MWKQIGDQFLHVAWAAAALAPVLLWPTWWGGALSGLAFALPRELVDQWPINRWWDTVLDLAFFGIGGAAVVLLLSARLS